MMKKFDLKPFYVVKTRNGSLHLVGQDADGLCLISKGECMSMLTYDEDMYAIMPEFDIIEVYGYSKCLSDCKEISTTQRELLWQREKLKGNTKQLLNGLGRVKVDTGSSGCMGCEYNYQCSTRGCAIIREAHEVIAQLARTEDVIRKVIDCEN